MVDSAEKHDSTETRVTSVFDGRPAMADQVVLADLDTSAVNGSPDSHGTSDPRPPSSKTQWVLFSVVSVLLTTSCGAMCLAAFRGLGLSDDGFVMLITRHPSEYLALPTHAHLFWNVVYNVVGSSIPALRIAGYVLALLGAWYLSIGVKSVMRSVGIINSWPKVPVATLQIAIVCTGFAPHMIFYQTPGYNNLAVLTFNMAIGSVLCLISAEVVNWSRPRQMIVGGVLGIAWWLLLLTKWPVGLVAGLLFIAVLVLFRERWTSILRRTVVSASISMILAALCTHFFLAPLPRIIEGVQKGSADLTGRYESGILISQFLWHTAILIGELFAERWYWVVAALMVALVCNRWRSRFNQWLIVAFIATYVTIEAILGHMIGGLHLGALDVARSIPHLTILLTIIVGVRATRDEYIRSRFTRIGTATILLSMASIVLASAGTNNPFYTNATISTGAWIFVILMILGTMIQEPEAYLTGAITVSTIVLFSAVTGTWLHPFQHDDLRNATAKIEEGPAAGLYVTPKVLLEIEALQDHVDKIRQGSNEPHQPARMVIIALNPGLAFASDSVQPIYAWVTPTQDSRIFEMWNHACEDKQEPFLFLMEETFEVAPIVKEFRTSGACGERQFELQDRGIVLQPPDVRTAANYNVYVVPRLDED